MSTWPIVTIVGVLMMCTIRGAMAAIGYVVPNWLAGHLGADPDANPQMAYVERAWAARDVALTVVMLGALLTERRGVLVPVLWTCVAIDTCDVMSAWMARRSGTYSRKDYRGLTVAAVAALVPELVALAALRL